jgi:hypothetical protein
MLDYSSAFNTVDRQHLLDKLNEERKIPSWLLRLVHSYLTENSQSVSYGKDISSPLPCRTGVLQGGVLSPFLFTRITTTLRSSKENVKIIKYADDTAIVASIKNDGDLRAYSEEVQRIVDWSKQHDLILNPDKCQELVFSNTGLRKVEMLQLLNAKLTVNGFEITPVHEARYLGVIIDDKLSFRSQVEIACKKAFSRSFFAVQLLRSTTGSLDAIRNFVDACILPALLYELPIYGGLLSKEACGLLSRTLKRLAQVSGRPVSKYKQKVLNQIQLTRDTFLANLRSDVSHPLSSYYCRCFRMGGVQTRKQFIYPKVRTTKFKNSFLMRGIRNQPPVEL